MTGIVFFAGAVLLWLATRPFDRRLRWLHQYSSFWAAFYLWVNPFWRVDIRGREHLDRHTPTVFVSNHQSALDILVAYCLFTHFKWVSKAELFRIPVIGWNMRLNRYVKLDRENKESAAEAFAVCRRHLTERSSVFFFPEGTRSRTGEIRPFKLGAFVLARKLKVPITPVAISGTMNALPKKSLTLQGHHRMSIRVLPPIPYEEFADTTADALACEVRRRIGEHVAEHPRAEPTRPVSSGPHTTRPSGGQPSAPASSR